MSAIAGIIAVGGDLDQRHIAAMADALSIYGSSRVAIGRLPGAHFATCLRYATPEDIFDTQPLYNREGGLLVIFDGRIDNREDLAAMLAISPADLAIMADSQLMFEFIQLKGIQAIAQVVGDFVLACYFARERQLVVARDAMGARPLYWSHSNDKLVFSSMPKGLLAVPGSQYGLNEQGLYDFLCVKQGGQAANLFQGMNILPPGTLLQFSAGTVKVTPFFEFDCAFERSSHSSEADLEQLSELMAQATRARLRTTGDVASQLSSGLDSAIVTAFAAQALHDQGKKLHALTATPVAGQDLTLPRGWYADEGPGARAISNNLQGVTHHLVSESAGKLSNVLAKEIELLNAPVLFPCNLTWHAQLRRLAIENSCTLMLNGNRGNLTISYDGADILSAFLGDLRLQEWSSEAAAWGARLRWQSILNLSLGPHFPRARMLLSQLRGHPGLRATAQFPIGEEFAQHMAPFNLKPQSAMSNLARNSSESRRRRVDAVKGWESAHYDMADNACGIDVRDPTADRRVVEYCLSLPLSAFCKAGNTRQTGRHLLSRMVSSASNRSPDRGYQGANWRHDLCKDLSNIKEHFERFRNSERHRHYLAVETCLEMLGSVDPSKPDTLPLDHPIRFFVLRALSVGLFLDNFSVKDQNVALFSEPIAKIEEDLRAPQI